MEDKTEKPLPARSLSGYLFDPELGDGKMLFVSGPRQVGKTTLVKRLLTGARHGAYFSWDNPAIRRAYAADPLFFLKGRKGGPFLAAFDEIHKRHKWKDILKGLYDSVDREVRIIVTGSARLEWFRKSGDSLVGRYLHYHMLPLSLSEVLGSKKPWQEPLLDPLCEKGSLSEQTLERAAPGISSMHREALDHLMNYSGFPEPFMRSSDRFLRKWRQNYLSLIVREDIRDLSRVSDLDRMENLALLLPSRVGNPLSLAGIARDLESNHATVKNSVHILETLWLTYLIRPWNKRMHRSLCKEPKGYLTDWTAVPETGVRFENLIASHLLKACTIYSDRAFGDYGLWYLRNFDGNEVDFLITKDGRPMLCVETKESDTEISRPALNLAAQTGAPLIQAVNRPNIFRKVSPTAWVISAEKLLALLP